MNNLETITSHHRISDIGLHWASEPVPTPNAAFAAQVDIAVRMMRTAPRAKNQNAAVLSYHLKHRIERAAGTYISNGAVIAAAHLLNLPVWPSEFRNAYLGLSRAFLKPLMVTEAK